MFHVSRSADGSLLSVSRQPFSGSEELGENHPDIQNFLNAKDAKGGFSAADAEFVRVLEDLIDTLFMKNVIRHTDLPAAAQKKLLQRKGLRNRVTGALDLLDGGDRIL